MKFLARSEKSGVLMNETSTLKLNETACRTRRSALTLEWAAKEIRKQSSSSLFIHNPRYARYFNIYSRFIGRKLKLMLQESSERTAIFKGASRGMRVLEKCLSRVLFIDQVLDMKQFVYVFIAHRSGLPPINNRSFISTPAITSQIQIVQSAIIDWPPSGIGGTIFALIAPRKIKESDQLRIDSRLRRKTY
jgi:hypothetical protein